MKWCEACERTIAKICCFHKRNLLCFKLRKWIKRLLWGFCYEFGHYIRQMLIFIQISTFLIKTKSVYRVRFYLWFMTNSIKDVKIRLNHKDRLIWKPYGLKEKTRYSLILLYLIMIEPNLKALKPFGAIWIKEITFKSILSN